MLPAICYRFSANIKPERRVAGKSPPVAGREPIDDAGHINRPLPRCAVGSCRGRRFGHHAGVPGAGDVCTHRGHGRRRTVPAEAGPVDRRHLHGLCLAESLIETNRFDAADQMRHYLRWWREGHLSSTGRCFDIGNTTRTALMKFEATGEPYAGGADPYSAGNGSIMRLAPVPLSTRLRPDRSRTGSRRRSRAPARWSRVWKRRCGRSIAPRTSGREP